jgi:prepilin-type N-terminal cleavage/methylation domain-containing protein
MRKKRWESIARGFTLVELLVVILIILLVSAATLPLVVPALLHRQVGEGARLLQGALVGARDAAIRSNVPRGIRLLSDPLYRTPGGAFASNRFVPIELGPDYFEGRIAIKNPVLGGVLPTDPPLAIRIEEDRFDRSLIPIPNARTSWFWNLRLGDKIRLSDSGRYYTIVGPYLAGNPEGFINVGPPGTISPLVRPYPPNGNFDVEYVLLVNGQDDNQNGYVDEGFDGLDNNGNGIMDLNDFTEWETEAFVGPQLNSNSFSNQTYHVLRRPVPSQGARETTLPADVVIDMSSITLTNPVTGVVFANLNPPERSRLPVDLTTGYVDILFAPNGTILQSAASSNAAPPASLPFYHFWLAERADVFEPIVNPSFAGGYYLPMPEYVGTQKTPHYPFAADTSPRFLKGDRRLVTIFPRTGQIITSSIENFDADPVTTYNRRFYFYANMPFLDAQAGLKEEIK